MEKVFSTICLVLIVGGCMGRDANPIAMSQIHDYGRSCKALELEVAQNDALIVKKMQQDKSKFWSNALWLVVLPPLMDVKEAEKVEAEALRERNKRLKILMFEKGCD